jgi:hypothetical protein
MMRREASTHQCSSSLQDPSLSDEVCSQNVIIQCLECHSCRGRSSSCSCLPGPSLSREVSLSRLASLGDRGTDVFQISAFQVRYTPQVALSGVASAAGVIAESSSDPSPSSEVSLSRLASLGDRVGVRPSDLSLSGGVHPPKWHRLVSLVSLPSYQSRHLVPSLSREVSP